MRTAGQLGSIGLSFVIAIVLGVVIGQWVDGRFGTKPWGFFVFFVLGIVAGVLNVYRTTRDALK
jgi:F0F1-type ATP synthase assembly protein I